MGIHIHRAKRPVMIPLSDVQEMRQQHAADLKIVGFDGRHRLQCTVQLVTLAVLEFYTVEVRTVVYYHLSSAWKNKLCADALGLERRHECLAPREVETLIATIVDADERSVRLEKLCALEEVIVLDKMAKQVFFKDARFLACLLKELEALNRPLVQEERIEELQYVLSILRLFRFVFDF